MLPINYIEVDILSISILRLPQPARATNVARRRTGVLRAENLPCRAMMYLFLPVGPVSYASPHAAYPQEAPGCRLASLLPDLGDRSLLKPEAVDEVVQLVGDGDSVGGGAEGPQVIGAHVR